MRYFVKLLWLAELTGEDFHFLLPPEFFIFLELPKFILTFDFTVIQKHLKIVWLLKCLASEREIVLAM